VDDHGMTRTIEEGIVRATDAVHVHDLHPGTLDHRDHGLLALAVSQQPGETAP